MAVRIRVTVTLFLTTWVAGLAAAAPRPMKAVDLLEIPLQGSVRVAPDASRVLFTRTEADWKQDRTVSHVWMVRGDGGEARPMTNGERGESAPRWSPDGAFFCFVARRVGEESQLWLQRVDGGEAVQLTDHVTSVSDPTWSPDGTRVYFTASDEISKEEKARREATGEVISYDRDFQQEHLWSVTVTDHSEKRVTEGDFSILGYTLSRDGATLVYMAAPTPLYDDSDESEIYVRPVAGGEARRLTHNGINEYGAVLSPDGNTVLFIADANQAFEEYYQGNLFVVPAAGGPTRLLLPEFTGEVRDASWSTDGSAIVFLANVGVHQHLYRLDLESGEVRAITSGDRSVRSWQLEPGSGTLVYGSVSPSSPGDIWLRAPGGEPRRLTRFEEAVAEEFQLPRVEAVRWKGRDGVPVEGLLTYPIGYEKGTRYPLVVQAHGGPAAATTFSFPRWPTYTPILAAMGYAVLNPNYRGSTGYGDEFLRDMVGHYFREADDDVMAGVDAMISRGIADPDKLVMMGWSAGGHMTNWLVTQTDRFKAASSGAGASDWISMYAQSDVRIYRTPWFGGTPWEKGAPIATYLEHSPISYVWRAKTPTLILVGEEDPRVPMPQSVEMFRALRANGVETELLVFPGEPHGPRTLKHRLHKINAELAWFEHYVFGREYEMEKPPVASAKQSGDGAGDA